MTFSITGGGAVLQESAREPVHASNRGIPTGDARLEIRHIIQRAVKRGRAVRNADNPDVMVRR